MQIWELFESIPASLPKKRTNDTFETYLLGIYRDYLDCVDRLDPSCYLGSRVLASKYNIEQVGRWVSGAVQQYLQGQPEKAYRLLRRGIYSLNKVGNLVTKDIAPTDLVPLYRMDAGVKKDLSKKRLFHIPLERRHLVGRHRYGIPGFPCLYLGSSLQVCRLEIGLKPHKMHQAAIAEFAPTHTVRLLDLGYCPSQMAIVAKARLLAQSQGQNNTQFDDFIVNYAICWPLIAACAIQKLHNGKDVKFSIEYIIPQLLLQWVMRETMCDGIRYFSTWVEPDDQNIRSSSNFVFPALPPPSVGQSQKLKNLFVMTEPCKWKGMNLLNQVLVRLWPKLSLQIMADMFDRNAKHLESLPKSRL